MTDETREQIKRDAAEWSVLQRFEGKAIITRNDTAVRDYADGATHQHPIAFSAGKREGRREAIEEALNIIDNFGPLNNWYDPRGDFAKAKGELIKELEKLKL